MPYQMRETSYKHADLERADLLSIQEAADALGMTLPGVIAAINRGELTEVVDVDARNPYRDRRFVIREEIQAAVARRSREPNEELPPDAPSP